MNGDKWILLVEDNVNDADLATRALTTDEAHVEVVVARDGAEALDRLHSRGEFHLSAREKPILVLLDLKMPRVDGFEVLEEIKADPHLKQIPVVIFTSSREERDVVRCYQLGANAYVVKPAGFKQLFETVQEILRFWININEPSPTTAPRTAAATIAA